MFFSIKRKVSNAFLTGLVVLLLVVLLYLCRALVYLYQDYQKLTRLESYLSDIDEVMAKSDQFQLHAEKLGGDFDALKEAVQTSLNLNLFYLRGRILSLVFYYS